MRSGLCVHQVHAELQRDIWIRNIFVICNTTKTRSMPGKCHCINIFVLPHFILNFHTRQLLHVCTSTNSRNKRKIIIPCETVLLTIMPWCSPPATCTLFFPLFSLFAQRSTTNIVELVVLLFGVRTTYSVTIKKSLS